MQQERTGQNRVGIGVCVDLENIYQINQCVAGGSSEPVHGSAGVVPQYDQEWWMFFPRSDFVYRIRSVICIRWPVYCVRSANWAEPPVSKNRLDIGEENRAYGTRMEPFRNRGQSFFQSGRSSRMRCMAVWPGSMTGPPSRCPDVRASCARRRNTE